MVDGKCVRGDLGGRSGACHIPTRRLVRQLLTHTHTQREVANNNDTMSDH
jgi:hypothetical protein